MCRFPVYLLLYYTRLGALEIQNNYVITSIVGVNVYNVGELTSNTTHC